MKPVVLPLGHTLAELGRNYDVGKYDFKIERMTREEVRVRKTEGEIAEVSRRIVLGRSLSWGLSTVVFGLLPVWATFLMTMVDRDISFSKIEFLKSGGIVIFAITITVSVLVDYYLSQFRFSGPAIGLLFNVFFPAMVCICGMIIHVTTVIARNDSLVVPFVINANIAIAAFSLIYCLIQKALLVSADHRQ